VLRFVRLASLAVVAVLAVGCSSSSSGGSPAADRGPASSPASAGAVDRAGVDQVLADVIRGLRTATAISSGTSLGGVAQSLAQASTALGAAAQGLNATPAGVPQTLAVPIAVRLDRLSRLLHASSSCLIRHEASGGAGVRACLPPLRRAEAKDAALAHQLISLSAYGSQSPKVFEGRLVQALRGE
jgi:hypothetical protein